MMLDDLLTKPVGVTEKPCLLMLHIARSTDHQHRSGYYAAK
jgi:hypothetical protein